MKPRQEKMRVQTAARGMYCLLAGIAAIAAGLSVSSAFAQGYPSKPIRLVVGFTAGGSTDITSRLLGQKLTDAFGQPVIIENRPGASGAIAIERVATSPADGYTLLTMASAYTILPALYAKFPYDMDRDFTAISMVATVSYLLAAHPSVPARNVKDLLVLARSQPGKLNFGSAGIGSAAHLVGELFKLMGKVDILHVAYKGGVQSAMATMTGEVDISFGAVTAALPLLQSGKLKAIAVTSARRASVLPAVPTIDESGLPGFDRASWYGLVAPAGVPNDIIARLAVAVEKGINSPDMKDSLNKQGLDSQTSTPAQFKSFIQREIVQSARLVKLAGVKGE